MLKPTLEARDAPMTSPTAKVFDNKNTSSSAVNWGRGLLAACVIIILALSGIGLLGTVLVAPFLIFGLTLLAVGVMILLLPVLVLCYYFLLILALPIIWHKLD